MIGKVQQRWYDLTQELDESISRYHLLSKDFVEFEEERRNVNAWLTDIEVRLIGLEQVGNDGQNEEQRLQELKVSIFPQARLIEPSLKRGVSCCIRQAFVILT